MSFESFKRNVSNWFSANKPTLLTIGGIGCMLAGTVASCWATVKVNRIISETNSKVRELKVRIEEAKTEEEKRALKKEGQRLIRSATGRCALYYAPGVGLTGLGITGICFAGAEYKSRLAKSAAAFSAVNALLSQYQTALIEKNGQDADDKIRLGVIEKKKLTHEVMDPDTGELKKVKEEITVIDPNLMGSPYAFYFDETTSYDFVEKNGLSRDLAIDIAKQILKAKEVHFNDLLKANSADKKCRQPVFMSDILRDLAMKKEGIPRYDKNGNVEKYDIDLPRVCGWVYDPDNPNVSNYIDLRIREVYVAGEDGHLKKTLVLDPNVDGNVLGYEYVR